MYTTSQTLLGRMKQGRNEADWRRFVDLYTPLLYFWANRNGLQDSDAADLVQEVLSLLVKKLPEFDYDPQKSFRGWLRTVTLNRLRTLRRRRMEHPQSEAAGQRHEEPVAYDEGFWEVDYHQHLAARALEIMRDSFETNTWKACWELVVSGRTAAEVGADLGLSEGAVYVAKSRVLKRLREELDGLWE